MRLHPHGISVPLTQFDSPILDGSSKIAFGVFHKSVLGEKNIGRCDIDVEELLKHQSQDADNGESFFGC